MSKRGEEMSRPVRCRRICGKPKYDTFGPVQSKSVPTIQMGLDEYECIRLIDLFGLSQEECAEQMEVARTTVTSMYDSARKKLAKAFVEGEVLVLIGGNYRICEESNWCARRNGKTEKVFVKISEEDKKKMKIAVTFENGSVFQHFGHSRTFKIYSIENGTVVQAETIPVMGEGHGALASFLQSLGVNTLICGGIGAGARMALREANIEVYAGVSGAADEAVLALLEGTLKYDPDALCRHHGDHGGHQCHHGNSGEHHCHHGGHEHRGGCGGHGGISGKV